MKLKYLLFCCLLGLTDASYAVSAIPEKSIEANESFFPDNVSVQELKAIVNKETPTEPKNELGFDQDAAYLSDIQSHWTYSSLHYYRFTEKGTFGGRVNYFHFYGTSAKQYQIEAYPLFLNNTASGAFSFAYANNVQVLFPNYRYTLEGFFDLPHEFEFSIGQYGERYIRFNNQKIFTYTGSFGKYFDKYFVWIRPYHYTPKNVEFYELNFQKTFSDNDNYVGMVVGGGKVPGVGSVFPLEPSIIVNQKELGINGQFSLTKSVFLSWSATYFKQAFPNRVKRDITDVNLGLIWRF